MLMSFPLAFIVIRSIKETNYDDEKVRFVLCAGIIYIYMLIRFRCAFLQMVFVDDLRAEAIEKGSTEKTSMEPETPKQ
jgi:hypothetical protein